MDRYAAGMRFAFAAVLLLFLPPLGAQTRSDDDDALFRRLDANHDGYLSAQELAAPAAARRSWIAVDRNRDGRISRNEFGGVRNFAAAPSSGAAGGTRAPQPPGPQARPPRAEGRP